MEIECKTLPEVLEDLQRVAGDSPFLALGQTVFWDEPMKAGVAVKSRKLGYARRLVAGVHDTDYFAKLPSGSLHSGKFKAIPHNDTDTRGLWSAAGEFSTLFGSETVVTRETLLEAGLRLAPLQRTRPKILDEATEAWGWRGIVAVGENNSITAEMPIQHLLPELMATFDWASQSSLSVLAGEGRRAAEETLDGLRAQICELSEGDGLTLGGYYERLLPVFYEFAGNVPVDLETTRTTRLLKFNRQTWDLPRFRLLDLFVNPATRAMARAAYNQAIRGSAGLYELPRFGTGAIPFDVVIPGKGRGTLRLGSRGAVINTPKPQFLTFPKPITGVADLAAAMEAKFGPDCVIVGKAVALIGMLAPEFVFVFHEGASGYVKHSRRMHQILAENGHILPMNPILRIRYDAWSALNVCCSWLRLPEPFRQTFGTEELCAPSFAARWRKVGEDQAQLLQELGRLTRPIELIRFLDRRLGGSWHRLAENYEAVDARLRELQQRLTELQEERRTLKQEMRDLTAARIAAEVAKGEHWRARVFEREPTEADWAERRRLTDAVEAILHRQSVVSAHLAEVRLRQRNLVADPEILRIHEQRRTIEEEAELKRLRLIRDAVTASRGLEHANFRPTAWWFPLVCPDGLWFRETIETAQYYLEPLS